MIPFLDEPRKEFEAERRKSNILLNDGSNFRDRPTTLVHGWALYGSNPLDDAVESSESDSFVKFCEEVRGRREFFTLIIRNECLLQWRWNQLWDMYKNPSSTCRTVDAIGST